MGHDDASTRIPRIIALWNLEQMHRAESAGQ